MFKRLKVAAINFVPWKWHKEWNSDKLEMCIKEAAKRGAKLAVAPEENSGWMHGQRGSPFPGIARADGTNR